MNRYNKPMTSFKNAYLPALKRQNIQNIGVFKPKTYEPNDTLQRTLVLIPFASLEAFEALETQLLSDKKFQQDGADFINAAHDKQPYTRISSILLKAFVDMPTLKPTPLKVNAKTAFMNCAVTSHPLSLITRIRWICLMLAEKSSFLML